MINFIAANWQWLVPTLYGLVVVVWLGVWRELHGAWHEYMWFTLLWPVGLAFAAGWGILWCLMLLGRGPIMLGRYVRRRRARVES